MAEQEHSLAVLVDFENMARPGLKGRGDFDIHLVLNRLAEKGRVLVKRAYADWSRYREARHELQNAGLSLIEMPSAREGAKNRADIQMAVDAMELAYSREHVNNFVIVSGDSDFTPLVGKLRELNKRVVGVGNRESSSELLIANCDEFIFYDLLSAGAAATQRAGGGRATDPLDLLRSTLTALQREGVEWPLASVVKDSMRRKSPAFDENEFSFSTFSRFLDDAAARGVVRLETDARSGTYRVELTEGRTSLPAPPSAALLEERAPAEEAGRRGEEPEGRRRRRRARRSESSPASETAGIAAVAASGLDSDVEVFEVVVTPTPDVDLSALPPLDEPISYEDMIMLGPEPGEDVPDLTEATDLGADAPPSRSSRRRRRRGVGEAEPTTADLATGEADADGAEPAQPVEGSVAGAPDDAADLGAVEAPTAEVAEAVAEPSPSRRRRRRVADGEAVAAPAPADEAVPGPAEDGEVPAEVPAPPAEEAPADAPDDGEQLPLTVPEEPAAEEAAPAAPRRGRVRRGTVAAAGTPVETPQGDPLGAEALGTPATLEPGGPVADPGAPVADAEAPAEEKPRRRRAPRKAAEPAPAEAAAPEAGEDAAEAKPARRRTTRKRAEPAEATPEAGAEAAEEKPKRRRAPRKKADEPAAADEVPISPS